MIYPSIRAFMAGTNVSRNDLNYICRHAPDKVKMVKRKRNIEVYVAPDYHIGLNERIYKHRDANRWCRKKKEDIKHYKGSEEEFAFMDKELNKILQ